MPSIPKGGYRVGAMMLALEGPSQVISHVMQFQSGNAAASAAHAEAVL
jgi:hypothetical protein